MPMPPPRATSEAVTGKRRAHEVMQITRALHDQGPADEATLQTLVGSSYWDEGRFARALAWAVANGRVIHDADGKLAAT